MSALAGDRSRRIELVCFAALACVAALRWVSLVTDPPSGRVAFAVVLATAAGAILAATARLPSRRTARWLLAAAITACAVVLGLVLVGLPARLLLPIHWGELGSNVDRSLNGISDVPVPYAGADPWTRLVIVLVAPLVVGLASLAAFWPARHRAAGRICALVLLVGLYLVSVAWVRPDRELASGVLLLVLVCAWLWLPALPEGRRGASLVALALTGAVAIPTAAVVDPGRPLVDYRHWNLFSANGLSFRWDQSYGPLEWPQKGTLLFEVASEHSHYWKAANLDRFDGIRWLRSGSSVQEPALGQPLKFHPKGTPPRPDPEWVDRINFGVRGLSSGFAIGAGTVLALNRTSARPAGDGTWEMTRELRPGNTYTALVYDPKPSAREMRGAGTAFPDEARRYVAFSLPGDAGARAVDPGFWGSKGPPDLDSAVSGTPYGGMYALARQLTNGARTPYDAITRIQTYLRGAYEYRQDVPEHSYPLAAFISVDKAGYCQQFSGTMALMLRMLGIPSRVAAGFSPGGRDPERNNFLVDDTDAHNWVEAFFPGVGWGTFDPTPAAAPAATQLNDNALGVTKPELPSDQGSPIDLSDPRGGNVPDPKPTAETGTLPGPDHSASHTSLIAGAIGGALALLLLATYGYRRLRTRRLDPDELADAELA
ncbi:MAG TPA: transglutaminaseTgpA domain-containing protein, partial [Solirubrobacterales bacterium]|nr:transglutaminaseTgpA domain-containing protein [Solirubrobacterales bacterium]